MDQQLREALQTRMARHQPPRWWAFRRRHRCGDCGQRWPCFPYQDARLALNLYSSGKATSWAETNTQPQPTVGPLLTRGQRFRANGWWGQ